MKNDLIRTHLAIIKRQHAAKNNKYGVIDVQAIPEKGSDDPFGLIDKNSNNDSLRQT